jgi:hypothetical protein
MDYTPKSLQQPKQPRKITYGIGIEHRPNEFGMTHGPIPNIDELLEVAPFDNKARIIRFNENYTEDIIYIWNENRWESWEESAPKIDLLKAEIDRLLSIIAEVHAWAVCWSITSPADMMQNIERIVTITTPISQNTTINELKTI